MNKIIKPINGSWFSIFWLDKRHYYWNDACVRYTCEEWDLFVREIAELGMEYLVMCNVAIGGKAVYDSVVLPKVKMACDDPMEAAMTGADKYGVKIFVTNDYYKDEYYFKNKEMFYPEVIRARFKIMEEVAEKYSHHKSFYGWYWAWESFLNPYFPDHFFNYVNSATSEARKLTPKARFLTAPYGTYQAVCDDKYIKQLEKLDIDIIAYQDEVGCFRMGPDGSKRSFEILRKAHDKVPQRALWADVETFTWEGTPNIVDTALIPAPFERLEKQLEAVSPYVDKILVFIFQGILSNPDSKIYTGYSKAGIYYTEYVEWLKINHPQMIKTI